MATDTSRVERAAFTIPEWAARHGLSRAFAYKILREGRGPRTFTIGRSRRVSRAADEEWRRAQEEAAS